MCITNKECFDAFVDEMRKVLKKHNPVKGDSWRTESEEILVDKLLQEVHEFEIKNDPTYELVDIANSAYLLWARKKLSRG